MIDSSRALIASIDADIALRAIVLEELAYAEVNATWHDLRQVRESTDDILAELDQRVRLNSDQLDREYEF